MKRTQGNVTVPPLGNLTAAMRRHAVMAGALLVMALAVPAWAAAADAPRTITVTGEGQADAIPDMALITLGVTRQEKTATGALDGAAEVARSIAAQLQEFRIAPRDIQSSDVSLNPQWVTQSGTNSAPPRIDGFIATLQVTVRVRQLDRLGDVLGSVASQGANRFGGLRFAVQYPEPLIEEARRGAVADARARARLYAQAAGVELGPVLSLHENGGGGRPPREMAMLARDASVPISPGELSYSASVTMVFAISGE